MEEMSSRFESLHSHSCPHCRRTLVIEQSDDGSEQSGVPTGEAFPHISKLLESRIGDGNMNDGDLEASVLQLASEESQVDLPICEYCISRVLKDLDKQHDDAVTEREQYVASSAELEARCVNIMAEQDFDAEMQQFAARQAALLAELGGLSEEHTCLQKDLVKVGEQTRELEELEYRYWQDLSQFKMQLQQGEDQRDSLQQSIVVLEREAGHLQKTDILEECFRIQFPALGLSLFSQINGFRMGTLPAERVEWTEINAAWGQAALLLCNLAKKCSFSFSEYDIVPKGSQSYIQRRSDKYNYELYAAGNRLQMMRNRRYDQAMMFFLEDFVELYQWAKQHDPTFALPHSMDQDKVAGHSIKLQFNSEEVWASSVSAMLQNLACLTQWVTAHVQSNASPGGIMHL